MGDVWGLTVFYYEKQMQRQKFRDIKFTEHVFLHVKTLLKVLYAIHTDYQKSSHEPKSLHKSTFPKWLHGYTRDMAKCLTDICKRILITS